MKLKWHKVSSVSTLQSTMTVYAFGPCLRYGYNVGSQMKYVYEVNGKRFVSESAMVRFVDSIAI